MMTLTTTTMMTTTMTTTTKMTTSTTTPTMKTRSNGRPRQFLPKFWLETKPRDEKTSKITQREKAAEALECYFHHKWGLGLRMGSYGVEGVETVSCSHLSSLRLVGKNGPDLREVELKIVLLPLKWMLQTTNGRTWGQSY